MSSSLVIDVEDNHVEIAFLENRKLIELHKESANQQFSVGDIYLGKVNRLAPGLNAAFVDVGAEKDAFLHYHDLGPQAKSAQKYLKNILSGKQKTASLTEFTLEADIDKHGKIPEIISEGQPILVQVTKEPISTKGPRIASEITLAGRYIVLVPFSNKISVSQRISSRAERDRLIRLINSIRPQNFGVIIRTVAQNIKVAELDADMTTLINRWDRCYKNLRNAKPPKIAISEMSRTSSLLRDMLNPSFTSIHINNEDLFQETKEYLKSIAPEKEGIVKLYTGELPIFDFYGVQKQIKMLFGKNVTVSSGAYLVIEHTEALHVIDVNSGNTAKSNQNQEENALKVNMDAATQVAHQLRLRDMGGIIVIDFIDLRSADNKKKLLEHMRSEMRADRAKHTILPLSKFGLMQITRQRVRPEMNIKTMESCPSCGGTGEIESSYSIVDLILSQLDAHAQNSTNKAITLCVNPLVTAYLKKGYPSMQTKWLWKYKKSIKIRAMDAYGVSEFRFFDGSGKNELKKV